MFKKLKKIQKKVLLHRNVHFLRYPTLTRPLINAPLLPATFLEGSPGFSDIILGRICTAFQKSDTPDTQDDIWTELSTENSELITALRTNDFSSLRNLFENLFHGPLTFGMAHTDIFLTKKSPYGQQYFSLRCRDMILALAEALAVKTLSSNQQTSLEDYLKSIDSDLEVHIENIEKALGHSIQVPDVGHVPAATIGRYKVSPDSIRHAYVMYRVKQLGYSSDSPILEIGGGFGNVARYAFLQNFRNYTIIDLPYVTAIQAAFLSAAIGEENITLFGETNDAAVKIIPSSHKDTLPNQFDLALNMDSLPEISLDEALEYLRLVSNRARHFLSINQEAEKTHKGNILQYCVPKLVEQAGGFKRLHRHPYWMEQGYAEELYKTNL